VGRDGKVVGSLGDSLFECCDFSDEITAAQVSVLSSVTLTLTLTLSFITHLRLLAE